MLKKFIKKNRFKISLHKNNFTKVKKVTPEEIRNTIRLMRINNSLMNFSQYDKYTKWSNPNEAIDVFSEYVNYYSSQFKLNYLINSSIFDDIKLLLKNIEGGSHDSNTYFYHELIKLLRKLYIDNFKTTYFINNNVQYCLRAFVFLKTIVEQEFLVRDSLFMNDFFSIINECANIYIEKLYIEDLNMFIKNSGNMEEFLTRFLSIAESKYIMAYNPKFYNFTMVDYIQKILCNFENLILHFVINNKPNMIGDRIKEIAEMISKRRTSNERVIDYINMFLVSNKIYFNIFYLIEILDYLTVFKQCTNYEILNYFYNCLENEINSHNLINFPKDYLIKSISILSQNHLIGSFSLIEKIVNVLIDKGTEDIILKDLITVIVSCLRSGFNDKRKLDFFHNLIMKNKLFDNHMTGINYKNVRNIKTLMERFINEEYTNEDFFKFLYLKVSRKLEELKIFKNEYNNEDFIEYVKNELVIAKTDFIGEIITEEDFIKYYQTCKLISLHCLFKINKNYDFLSVTTVDFTDENEKHTIIDYFE